MLKKCIICGAEFEAKVPTNTCSAECRAERHRQNTRASRARRTPEQKAREVAWQKAYRSAHKEYYAAYTQEYSKLYRSKNLEKLRAKGREYAASHREEARLRSRCYYWEHRDDILEKLRLERQELENAQDLEYWRGLIERNERWRKNADN